MSRDAVPVTLGGVTYLCPPMPFFCLERAWPHIQAMAKPDADFVVQTRSALSIIAASLLLDDNPPSYDDLARRMMGTEIGGMHAACTALLDVSGLGKKDDDAGEAFATGPTPSHRNGIDSSPN